MIKVGDKIRFLNAEGGGIVTKILKNGMVAVEDEFGFEIPSMAGECVVIESNALKPSQRKESQQDKIAEFFPQKTAKSIEEPAPATTPTQLPSRTIHQAETKDGEKLTIQLAFVPENIQQLQSTTINCYLINESNYFCAFQLATSHEEKYLCRYNGLLEPHAKMWIEEFTLAQLNEWERLLVQGYAFKESKPFTPKPAFSVEIKNDLVRFYKLHSYHTNEYFSESALIQSIIHEDSPYRSLSVDANQLAEAMSSSATAEERALVALKKQRPSTQDPLEVDLHIQELLDHTAGLSNSEILDIQLAKFHEEMKAHLNHKGKKIVFIHGKGEGVLRKSLIEQLKLRYGRCLYQDASFKEYGFGATLVIIK